MIDVMRTYEKRRRYYVIVEVGDPIYGGSKLKELSFKTKKERDDYISSLEEIEEIKEML